MMEGGQHKPSAADAIRELEESGGPPSPKRVAVSGTVGITEVLNMVTQLQQQQQQMMQAIFDQNESNNRAMTLVMERLVKSTESPGNVAPPPTIPMVEKAASSIPKELDEHILKRTRTFKDSVFKVSRSRNLLLKYTAEAETFAAQPLKYPDSVPSCKTQTTLAELDSPLDAATGTPQTITIDFPANISRRDALKLVHHRWCRFRADVMVEAQKEHLEVNEKLAHPSELEKIVVEVLEEASKPSLAEAFGLPKPLVPGIDESIIKKRVNAIYDKIFLALNKKLENDQLAAEKSKDALAESERQLLAKRPDELLGELVSSEVNAHLKKAGIINPMEEDSDIQPCQSLTENLVDALRLGNDLSPSAVVGQSQRIVRPKPKRIGKIGPYKGKEGKGKGSTTSDRNGGGRGRKGGKVTVW